MADATEPDFATLRAIVKRKVDDHEKLKPLFKYLRGAHDEESIYISQEKMEQFRIRLSNMDLDEGGRFFKPITMSEFKSWNYDERHEREIDWDCENWRMRDAEAIYHKCWDLIKSEIPEHAQTEEKILFLDYTPWRSVIIPHTRMGGNFANFFPDERTDWVAQTELDLYESRPSDSHVISFSTHGLRPDKSMESRLARSEILVALDIMMQRMLWLPHITNHIFPVLMISCFNRQFRANEVYLENGTLHFNCTPFINLETFDQYKYQLLVRWSLAQPIGTTTTYPNLQKLPDGFEKFIALGDGKRKIKKQNAKPTPKPAVKRLEELKRK
ncbi:TPA_exp: Uncharacterized protein A8136_3462 [Trichophyton benhamiae CBS 112371]|uniref:Uncharacterized protein n=1 Tax=Arthroderma benhamiae (strain ATCC MYA-4681 / CBS 112371) TaxID=663331 RepID=D4B0G9_ARTBC|nr:uncharacterized protein ARB_01944 [Trichophyton benhamiae CBS 112371]EFE31076.1 hypothetical protein ARB_01944 [Trichophyton benhamiae CBS 112371]DAA74264.1 TPA_exp: Uncharacterized protein A8136_3462 [Trichophyton benhamiae CBS 112371]